ncbi:MAG: phenylalanine--tRNA ligase subunit alpha [Pseudomonadota bacterium]
MITLRENEHRLLHALTQAEGGVLVEALATSLSLDQSLVLAAAATLEELGLAAREEQSFQEYRIDEAGRAWATEGLPERTIAAGLQRAGGSATIPELPAHCGLSAQEIGQALRFLAARGWAERQGGTLRLLAAPPAAPQPDEALLAFLAGREAATDAEILAAGIDLPAAEALLRGRKGAYRSKPRTRRLLMATPAGRAAAPTAKLRRQVNQLTGEMLADGSWREVDFRPYDMSLAAEPAFPGKVHPFRRVLEKTRRVFLELGFTEITSPFVESGFWDFDALFQPQDHPAREMQDTFYVGRPERCPLPAPQVVDSVRRAHQDGGNTGGLGWGYRWSDEPASRAVLRTHTTAATIRALSRDPKPPQKVFCVGKVFRRETVDYKHLPVFHQVDGIIIDEHASFASLLGTLDAFYRKMGFDKFEFRPAFFPYTEPSVEIFVWFESKQDWVEMGGAGVFRPEVTRPMGCDVPVLAWGLGLERLGMLTLGLTDIRQLYVADLQWLKEAALCR